MEQTITQNGALYLVQRKQAATTVGDKNPPSRIVNYKGKSDRNRFRHLPSEEQYVYRDNGR